MHAELSLVEGPGRELVCRVVEPVAGANGYHFKLMRHSTVVDEVTSTPSSSHAWDLTDPRFRSGGDYHVEVTWSGGRNGETKRVLESEWQHVASEKTRARFDDWLKGSDTGPAVPMLEWEPAPYPYEDIAVVSVRGSSPDGYLKSLLDLIPSDLARVHKLDAQTGRLLEVEEPALTKTGTNSECFVITSADVAERGTAAQAFGSGYAISATNLLRGSKTAETLRPRAWDSRLNGSAYESVCPGDFLTAVAVENHIEFHSDYFGTSSWFYFESTAVTAVASTFSLLIRTLLTMGVELELDIDVIDADLCSLTQGFQQPILDALPIKGARVLPPDLVLVLTTDGRVHYDQSVLGADIAAPMKLSDTVYEELVEAAASEIRQNCRAVLADSEFSRVVCDITGGLDSRTVLAGLLSWPEFRDKLYLRTNRQSAAPSEGDEAVAAAVAESVGLAFDDSHSQLVGPCEVGHLRSRLASATFGVYWLRGLSPTVYRAGVVSVGGTQLDDIARNYTERAWNISSERASNTREITSHLARQVFKWRGKATIKPSPRAGLGRVIDEWMRLPGNECDKASQVFNFHRGRFHGSGIIPARFGESRLNPGPTRALFRLKLACSEVVDSDTLQLDLLMRLNGKLARIPFGNKAYNAAFAKNFGSQDDLLGGDRDQLNRARRRSVEHRTEVACPVCDTMSVPDDLPDPGSRESLLGLIGALAKDDKLRSVMMPVWHWVEQNVERTYEPEHTYVRVLENKLYHLMYISRLTGGVDSRRSELVWS